MPIPTIHEQAGVIAGVKGVNRPCAVAGCQRAHKARGYCAVHYSSWYRTASPEDRQGPSRAERFWAKVDKTGDCWIWTGSLTDTGYGQFHNGDKNVRAHRWAYEEMIGPIPGAMVIDHTCHNNSGCTSVPCNHRACVNPAHLEPVTHLANVSRGRAGAKSSAKTHCANGHEYTPENTIWRRNGKSRTCRTCNRDYQTRYHAKRKAA